MLEIGPSQAETALADTKDETLAQQAAQDTAAFTQLYRRYVTPVYRYALFRLGSTPDAQRLTTQVFQQAYNQIARYQGEPGFAVWLMGIARRELGNYLQGEHALALPATKTQNHPVGFTLALSDLPADYADVLALRIFAGLNAAQVAQVLGNSEAEIKLMLRQALSDLQERLVFLQETQEWIEIEIKL
jgi:RNA polymerase sigma-70 factor (ECF subfamily)